MSVIMGAWPGGEQRDWKAISAWAALAFTFFTAMLLVRIRWEEMALCVEFGEEWQRYCERLPALLSKFHR